MLRPGREEDVAVGLACVPDRTVLIDSTRTFNLTRIEWEEDKTAVAVLVSSALYLSVRWRPRVVNQTCWIWGGSGEVESTPHMDPDSRERSCFGGFGNFEVLIQACVV